VHLAWYSAAFFCRVCSSTARAIMVTGIPRVRVRYRYTNSKLTRELEHRFLIAAVNVGVHTFSSEIYKRCCVM